MNFTWFNTQEKGGIETVHFVHHVFDWLAGSLVGWDHLDIFKRSCSQVVGQSACLNFKLNNLKRMHSKEAKQKMKLGEYREHKEHE